MTRRRTTSLQALYCARDGHVWTVVEQSEPVGVMCLYCGLDAGLQATDRTPMYPCRCGEVHSGDYGLYDYMHHNCFHEAELWAVDPDIPNYFLCSACGKPFYVKDPKEADGSQS